MKKFLLYFILLSLIHACKPDCPVELNPCDGYPTSFKIKAAILQFAYCNEDNLNYGDFQYYSRDSFSTNEGIRFELNYAYDSIQWRIGNDPRVWSSLKQVIEFRDPVGPVLIRAIGYRSPNFDCFGAGDDGIDTVYRKISLFHLDDAPIWGTFRGTNNGETDSFNITFGRDTFAGQGGVYYENYFVGLPKGSTYKIEGAVFRWYTYYKSTTKGGFTITGLSLCDLSARISGVNNENVEIKWRVKGDLDNPRIFKGIRIN